MRVFISIISHGHAELIQSLCSLERLSDNFNIVLKSNTFEDLSAYCKKNNINYINESYGLGFGANNNFTYRYCREKLGMVGEDFFLILNPDVVASENSIISLVDLMIKCNSQIAGVNLFKDEQYLIPDNSIRKFPSFTQFGKSFLGLGNPAVINKELVSSPQKVDWAAGSFLAFRSSHYARLEGFDEGYFMYCEDIDICYRSKLLGERLVFFPQIKMQHLAEHANRSIFSKHFYWHVKSVLRFLLAKKGLAKRKSCLL